MHQIKITTLIILFALLGVSCDINMTVNERPNIVYILADDLGYGDLSCYNISSKIYTPNIDQLADDSICFTNAHSSASVCTPTRYGLMTGRYCWRTSRKSGVIWAWEKPLLKKERLTLPEMLKEKGYITGLIGKWHLGINWITTDGKNPGIETKGENIDYKSPIVNGPLNHGYDCYYGDDVPNFPPYAFIENDSYLSIPTEMLPKNICGVPGVMAKGWKFENVLPALTQKAEEFIIRNKQRPFFLFVSITAPHEPIAPNKEFIGTSKAGRDGDFVQEVDARIGSILKTLEKEGLTENTLVIFSSDNGSSFQDGMPDEDSKKYKSKRGIILNYGHNPSKNFRGMKADAWEGGHRIPYIKYPGKSKGDKSRIS